jgi:HEAT repeat protein
MKSHRSWYLSGLLFSFVMLVVSAQSIGAVQIKLKSGAVFTGDIVSQSENFIVLKVGTANVSIAKKMIIEIVDVPVGGVQPAAGAPPSVTPAQPAPAAPSGSVSSPTAPAGQPSAQPSTPSRDVSAAELTPGREVEITLKNGAVFKGTVVAANEKLITLKAGSSAGLNIFRNVIATVREFGALSSATAPSTAATTPASTVQSQPQPKAEMPNVKLAPVAAPAAVVTVPAPVAVSSSAAAPAGQQPAAQPAPVPAGQVPSQPAQSQPMVNAPVSQPQPQPSPNQPVSPAPAAPVATVVAAPVPPPPAPAHEEPPVAKKRADGKNELVLKNGTAFIGTIVSENDRFLVFSTAEGVSINILRRLIKTVDGVPYVMKSAEPVDTTASLQRAKQPSASAVAAAPKSDSAAGKPSSGAKQRFIPQATVKPGATISELMDSLKSTSNNERSAALRGLGAMGQWANGAIPVVKTQLSDTAGQAVLPPLETDSATVQKFLPPGFEAARALSHMGPAGFDELKSGARGETPLQRVHAVFGIGETQDPASEAILREALKDGDPRVRAVAAHALRGAASVDPLVAMLDDRDGDVRTHAAFALGEVQSAKSVKALVNALRDTKPSVRAQAAAALGKNAPRDALAPLSAALNDIAPEVREKVILALGSLRDTAAVQPLLSALKDNSPFVRKNAAEALGRIRDPRAIPSLYTALQEKDDAVRRAVEASLQVHTEIPQLIAALDDESAIVRENSAYILWLMTGKELGVDKKAWSAWLESQKKPETKPSSGTPAPKEKKK